MKRVEIMSNLIDLMLTPKTISQIYKSSVCKLFRIRDINSLTDFLVLGFAETYEVCPFLYVEVLCCDNQKYKTLSCTERKYVLLSSSAELVRYRRYKRNVVISEVIKSYR